jgi:hypothetical protein
MEWFLVALNKVLWWALVNMILILGVLLKPGNFLTSWPTVLS